MNWISRFCLLGMALCVLVTSQVSYAQNTPQKKSDKEPPTKALIVNGHRADGAVVQIEGHSYVDIEAFAQATGAAVSVEATRIVVTLPNSQPQTQAPTKTAGLSREFAQAGIAAVSDMREWRGGIASALRFGVAAGNWLGPWLQDYQIRAQKSMDQASLAAKTDADHKAAELLRNELANVRQWDSQTQATIQSLNAEPAINPASTEDDPLRVKVSECSKFLASMLVSGEFADDANCH